MKIFGFSLVTIVLLVVVFFLGTKFPGAFSGVPIINKI